MVEDKVYYRYAGEHSPEAETSGRVQSRHDQTELGHVERRGVGRERGKEKKEV